MDKRKKCICYSGGLDSTAVLLLPNDYDTVLFFKTGTEDNRKEELVVRTLLDTPRLQMYRERLVTVDVSFLLQYELKNKVIPFRNVFFALIASNYGADIYFGFAAGDVPKDTDYVFKAQVEAILNYFGLDASSVHPVGYPYRILTPFRHYSKRDIVEYFKTNDPEALAILALTRSCYLGGEKECGRCRSCFRKYQAFRDAGLEDLLALEIDEEAYRQYVEQCRQGDDTEYGRR